MTTPPTMKLKRGKQAFVFFVWCESKCTTCNGLERFFVLSTVKLRFDTICINSMRVHIILYQECEEAHLLFTKRHDEILITYIYYIILDTHIIL
jgi:hypothetical protein